jgi:hypothetical protein
MRKNELLYTDLQQHLELFECCSFLGEGSVKVNVDFLIEQTGQDNSIRKKYVFVIIW